MMTDRLIAIVDDDDALRDSLANLMRSVGYRTHGFSSAEAFLSSPLAREAACVILDVRMAGMNGLELQRRLAAPGWHLPIIFLTAHGDGDARARALEAGAAGFLDKPCHDAELLDAIAAALRADSEGDHDMATIKTSDGTELYYKDWGSGQPIVFSHGWPLSADDWDAQMMFFGSRGFRCIAHDRRGHGRSTQTWDGNDMNTYADDLVALTETLDLKDAIHVGHSTGGGEVARYIGRHGGSRAKGRVAKAVLVGAVPPIMMKTPANPGGLPREVFDGFRAALLADRAQFFRDVPAGPFYGFNRPGAKVSQGIVDNWWRQGMMCGVKAAYDCIKAFSETDFTEDLKKIDVPTLVMHGDDDQVVPIAASAMLSHKLLKNGQLKVYPGFPHGMCSTHHDVINADLLAFFKG